jgi:hypothetical protein
MAGAVALAIPILSLCAIYNGSPLLYADSIDYLIHGGQAFRVLLHGETITWVNTRSFFYALAILALHRGVSAWPIVVAQSLATAWVLWLVLRTTLARWGVGRFLAIVALLTLATPAAWFTGYVMPDVFAPLLVLLIFLVGFAWDDLRRWERGGVAALLWFALVAHASHLLLGAILTAVVAAIGLTREGAHGRTLRPAARVVVAVVASALSILLLHRALLGEASLTGRHPLFLLARTLADGPTRSYLRAHCPELDLAICEFADRLPDNVRDVLWGEGSIWAGSDEAKRERLRAEETRVVVAALRADPWGQLEASARNAASQLTHFGMAGSFFPDTYILARIRDALPGSADRWLRSRQARGELHQEGFTRLHYASFGLSLLVLAALAIPLWRARPRRLEALVALVGVALLANASITGALSNVEDRYQARVAWLVPLLACLATCTWLDERRAHRMVRRVYAARPGDPTMRARTLLLAGGLVAIAALAVIAGSGLVGSEPPRAIGAKTSGVSGNSARRDDTATPQPATHELGSPRRGAGTVGARAGSLGAVAAPGGRTPPPAEARAAEAGATEPGWPTGWSGHGVEDVPPPTPGRDPREGETLEEAQSPPAPNAIASAGAAGIAPPPAISGARAPRASSGGSDDSGAHPDQAGSNEAVPSQGPLSEDEIALRLQKALPEGQAIPLSELLANDIRNKSNVASDLSH